MNMIAPRFADPARPETARPEIARPETARPPVHAATDLTAGGATAQIVLHGQTYTLRITRQGKLILTK